MVLGRSLIAGAGVPAAVRRRECRDFASWMLPARREFDFQHNSGAYGGKLLPETLGSGCAFLDYDADGWQDILLVNSMDWPGHKRQRTTLKLYHNNRNGTFTDVTKAAGLDVEMYGMGVAVGDYNNDGFPGSVSSRAWGRAGCFEIQGKGTFVDVTKASGLVGKQAIEHFGAVVRLRSRRAIWICSCAITCSGRRSTMCSAAWMERINRTARRKRIAATRAGCFATAAMGRSKMSRRAAECLTAAPNRWAWRCWITTRTAGRTCW